MTGIKALFNTEKQLEAAGLPEPRADAELLLAALLKCSRAETRLQGERELSPQDQATLENWLARRLKREPLQYILGEAPFMGFVLKTAPEVLIPRMDTESLCEMALHALKPGDSCLDIGTGSGCLAISLKLLRPACRVFACDLSQKALALARENAEMLGAQVDFRLGDKLAPFEGLCFDLILSNPPYIKSADLPGLQPEVLYEPKMALDGGADGLRFYRELLMDAPKYLNPGGSLILECGDGQSEEIPGLPHTGLHFQTIYRDLSGLSRGLVFTKDG